MAWKKFKVQSSRFKVQGLRCEGSKVQSYEYLPLNFEL
jgi:hypothetical protein